MDIAESGANRKTFIKAEAWRFPAKFANPSFCECPLKFPSASLFVKGTRSPDEYILKAYKIESVVYNHAPLFFKLLGCLVENRYFYCFYENPASFSVIGRFSPRGPLSTTHWTLENRRKYTCPRWLWLPIKQSGSSYRFDGQNRRLRASEEGYWKDFFRLSK
jgi:hypothetical protein